MKRRRSQKRILGSPREPLPACVIHDIKVKIEKLAREFNVSRSFVVATLLADAVGIRLADRYDS